MFFTLNSPNDIENHFMCLLTIHIIYLGKCVLKHWTILKIGLFVQYWVGVFFFYILDISPLSDVICKYFLSVCDLAFHFLNKTFIFVLVNLIFHFQIDCELLIRVLRFPLAYIFYLSYGIMFIVGTKFLLVNLKLTCLSKKTVFHPKKVNTFSLQLYLL